MTEGCLAPEEPGSHVRVVQQTLESEQQLASLRAAMVEEDSQGTSQVDDHRMRLVALVGRSLKTRCVLEPRPLAEVAEAAEPVSTY